MPPIPTKKRRWKIRSSSLTPNTTISCDLFDDLGGLLVAAGKEITQEIIDQLRARNLNWLLIDADIDTSTLPVTQQARPYHPDAVQTLTRLIEESEAALEDCCRQLETGEQVDVEGLESLLFEIANEAKADIAAVLAVTFQLPIGRKGLYHQMIQRSVRLAVLSTAVGMAMELSQIQLRTMGIAALFADVSLLNSGSLSDIAAAGGQLSAARNYLQHPIQSNQMTSKLKRVSPLARLVMAQVHEELDGNGFPHGISSWRIVLLSRILCVADIYITLADPFPKQLGIVPSDAIACLISHASSGKLCQPVTDALIRCMSIYPVGSDVLLDNGLRANVLRACPHEPYRPAVVVETPTSRNVDLRCCPYQIIAPLPQSKRPTIGRLRTSKLDEPVWRMPRSEYVDIETLP